MKQAEGFGSQTLQEVSAWVFLQYWTQVNIDLTSVGLANTEPGTGKTTRQVVAPKPGFVCMKSGEDRWRWQTDRVTDNWRGQSDLKGQPFWEMGNYLRKQSTNSRNSLKNGQPKSGKVRLNLPEGFKAQTLQPISHWEPAIMKGWLKGWNNFTGEKTRI